MLGSLLLPLFAPRPFFSPDEAFYAQVAREMAETGDFVVPRFDGQPWLEKPPLLAWLLVGAFALFGWGFPAAALVNLAATLATAIVVGAHVRRTNGDLAGFFTLCAYLTMLGPLTAAGTALTDPVLTLCTTAAVAAYLSNRRGAAVLCGTLLGLGVLAKGPVAPLVVVPAIIAAGVPSPRRAVRRVIVVIAVAAAVAAPWHLLLASRGLWKEFESVFLGQHVLLRAMTADKQGGPFWYYVPVLWLVSFPWGTQAALSATRLRRFLAPPEAATLAVALLGFSFSATKLPHYLLPLLPWVAVGLGRSAAEQWNGSFPPGFRLSIRLGGIAAGIALGLLVYWGPEPPLAGLVPSAARPILLAAAVACPFLGFLEAARWQPQAWLGWVGVTLSVRIVLLFMSLPNANGLLVEEPVARMVRDAVGSTRQLVAHQYQRPYLVAYGVRGWRMTMSRIELAATLAAAPGGGPTLALTSDTYEGELRAAAAQGYILEEVGRVRGLAVLGGPVVEVVLFRVEKGDDIGTWFSDFESLGPRDSGFGAREKNSVANSYRWTTDRIARLEIPAAPASSAMLRLRCWASSTESPLQKIVVRLNGHELGSAALPARIATLSFAVPESALQRPPQHLELEVSPLLAPAFVDASSRDLRALGVAIDWASLGASPAWLDLAP